MQRSGRTIYNDNISSYFHIMLCVRLFKGTVMQIIW